MPDCLEFDDAVELIPSCFNESMENCYEYRGNENDTPEKIREEAIGILKKCGFKKIKQHKD